MKNYFNDSVFVVTADKRPQSISVFFPSGVREDALEAAYQMLLTNPEAVLNREGKTAILYNNDSSAVVVTASASVMTVNFSASADKLKVASVDNIVSLCGGAAYGL